MNNTVTWCFNILETASNATQLRRGLSAGDRRERAIFAAAINRQALPVFNREI